MKENMKKLELEQILNQIRNNDYMYNGSIDSLSFRCINFILINGIYFYTHTIQIKFQQEYLLMKFNDIQCEVKYKNIKTFLINLRE